MSLAEASTVERFAHELAGPGFGDARDDMAARSRRMGEVVDEVLVRMGPKPGQSESERARNLALVEGLAALMTSGLDVLRDNLDAMDPEGETFDLAVAAYDDTVREYERLKILAIALDPLANAGPDAPVLDSAAAIDAWSERLFTGLDAQG
jgi:hypothetical protein